MLNIPIKDYFRETRLFNSRLSVAAAIALLLILLLLARLLYLQVVDHRHFATLSQENRVKPIPIPPPRGLILDRNGVVLAQDYPVYTLEVIPEQVRNMPALLKKLATIISLNATDLKNFATQRRDLPRFESLVLRSHLTDEEAARLAVNRPFLHGVELEARLQRYYPLGGLAVHALGYVGRINDQDLEHLDKAAYRGMDHIGKLGIEARYEDVLRGRVGTDEVETNARGRALRTLDRIPPVAGKTLYLNIDARLQAVIEQAFGAERGAAVALEPDTGAVLAFSSLPVYDPNLFVNGIDADTYRALLNDPDRPLVNRALNGQFAPGSTFKPFLALAGLDSGRLDPSHTIVCPGWFELPHSHHRFRCWRRRGHGVVNLHDAIVQSCDVFFYHLVVSLNLDAASRFLATFGFGAKTGIDLLGESSGTLPSPAAWRARGLPWYPGDTVVMGIGQGPILITPLQLADATAALANGGVRMRPELVHAIVDPETHAVQDIAPQAISALPARDRGDLAIVVRDMEDVVRSRKGTAYWTNHTAPYSIAAKTGTAQVHGIAQGQSYNEKGTPERLRDNALFISFAPVDHPKVAVAVVVENGGHGASTAAPVARKIMDYVILGKTDGATLPAPKYPGNEQSPGPPTATAGHTRLRP